MRADGRHPGHHHVTQAGTDVFHAFDDQTQAGQGLGQIGHVGVELGVVAKPGQRGAHHTVLELSQKTHVVVQQRTHVGQADPHLG